MRPGLPRFLRSSASVYYTERKPKNKKRGRPGNEATPSLLADRAMAYCPIHHKLIKLFLCSPRSP